MRVLQLKQSESQSFLGRGVTAQDIRQEIELDTSARRNFQSECSIFSNKYALYRDSMPLTIQLC